MSTDDASEEVPDFDALFEPHVEGDGWQMSPRMALQIWHALLRLADEWEVVDLDALVDDLPVVARPYAANEDWRRQFVEAFRNVANRLGSEEAMHGILLRCTAEEVALHLALDLAGGDAIAGVDPPRPFEQLPEYGQRVAFSWMREVLFEDHDVLMLYNAAFDGIEIDYDSNSVLHPRDWFRPFR